MRTQPPDTVELSPAPQNVAFGRREYANVLGVGVEALDMRRALDRLLCVLRNDGSGYVSAIDVHGVLEAKEDPRVAAAFAGASLTLPDGTPTVWIGRLQGHREMDHVTGPDFMLEVFGQREFASYSHFLYGGKPGVAKELEAVLSMRFPSARIVGTYTPPFRDLTFAEEDDLIARVGELKPDIIWVGIGSPRQDLFMRRMMPRLNTRMMMGVGAAFDFHTGRLHDCSPWIKRAGLQWLHRLIQDPKRLWRRNLRNMTFLWHIATQVLGVRTFRLHPALPDGEIQESPSILPPATREPAGSMFQPARSADRACSTD